jgi:hypothetical protein
VLPSGKKALLYFRFITVKPALFTSNNPGKEGCTEFDAHMLFLCQICLKIASGKIHNSRYKDVKYQWIHPTVWNFVHLLPRYTTTIVY